MNYRPETLLENKRTRLKLLRQRLQKVKISSEFEEFFFFIIIITIDTARSFENCNNFFLWIQLISLRDKLITRKVENYNYLEKNETLVHLHVWDFFFSFGDGGEMEDILVYTRLN